MLRSNWFIKIAFLLIIIFVVQLTIVGCAKKAKEEATEQKTTTEESAPAMETEKEIPIEELPAAVTDAFKAAYPGMEITEAEMKVIDGVTCYEIEFMLDDVETDVMYSADGVLLASDEDMEDEDEDEEDMDEEEEEEDED
ncbi:hypothetical protein K9N50_06385 [bacterium]|nr:hypothetical protein [bacterium]